MQRTLLYRRATQPEFHLPLPPGDAIIQVKPEKGTRPLIPVRYRTVIRFDGSTYRELQGTGL